MTSPGHPIADEVKAAIERGELIEAIKLLRNAKGVGLKEAKEMLEAYQRGEPAVPTAASQLRTRAAAAAGTAPQPVLDALRRGNTIEAIKWLHTHGGLDLKTAKEQVDALSAKSKAVGQTQSPGLTVMPRGGGAQGWIIGLIIAGLIAYALFGNGL